MEINISVEQAKEPVAVMHIRGDIDASNFLDVVTKAQETYKNPARNLLIDLSEVPYISSAGLVAIHRIALLYSGVPQDVAANTGRDSTLSSSARKHVKLLSPQSTVEHILETTGLKLFFQVFHDLESALASF
jgi:anti-anti-sigma factor